MGVVENCRRLKDYWGFGWRGVGEIMIDFIVKVFGFFGYQVIFFEFGVFLERRREFNNDKNEMQLGV